MAERVPAWLHSVPDGPRPTPPVDPRAQVLPFAELSWEDFERLIVRLVRREGDVVECSLYGTRGQAQEGLDVLAARRNEPTRRVCYQCKNVAEFGPADIVAAVDKFLSGAWAGKSCELVLCVALALTRTKQQDELDRQRARLGARNIGLSVWDASPGGALTERLKVLPELVDDFFGRPWVERFNSLQAAERLGERLDGKDFGRLRSRLTDLYAVLFAQHDPGVRTAGTMSTDVRARYVPAEISERTATASTAGSAADTQISMAPTVDGQTREGPTGMGSSLRAVTVYETRRPAFVWLRNQRDAVILGEPGYGKSALSRYLSLSILQPSGPESDALDPDMLQCLPVWMSFARFSAAIVREPHTSVDDFIKGWLHQHSFGDVYPLVQRAARSGQVLLIVDGLDEATTESSGREALDRIVAFLHSCSARVVCTSRPRGYQALGVPPSWATATLLPFSDEQIQLLAGRWFAILEPAPEAGADGPKLTDQHVARAQSFLSAARDSRKTLELARNPLLCQVLIQLFRFSHRLPEARVAAYQQILELLLSQHPAARAQAGGGVRPAERLDLRPDDLKQVLIRLSWAIQVQQHAAPLHRDECQRICAEFLQDDTYGLGESSKAKALRMATEVVDQLVTQYGVLVERAPGELSFVHLSLQEYLAAEHIARQSMDVQLNWLADAWLMTSWRESLISWLGILGARDRAGAGRAAQRLGELGEKGPWERMQSLELRCEIATSDVGIPVSEARRIVAKAVEEVEVSPFAELRSALARSIAVGALGSSVKVECSNAIRRWMPAYSGYRRVKLLEAFRSWVPSDALRATLLRGIHDEEIQCRRAAVGTFAMVFRDAEATVPALQELALHHVLPGVRAAALRGLECRPEWRRAAEDAADANTLSSDADLLLVVSKIRIRKGVHDDGDLNRMWSLYKSDAVDFWLRDDLVSVLCEGWPTHPALRRSFLETLGAAQATAGLELPLEYLIRCYPRDNDVADVIASLINRFGSHFSLDTQRTWAAMVPGFRRNPVVTKAVRAMLAVRRKEYEAIYWDPQTTPAYAVLDDDEARDDLLASYTNADFRGRYWIASALFKSWSEDTIAMTRLKEWTDSGVPMAAPLAKWGAQLVPNAELRREWLQTLTRASRATREIDAMTYLLKEFPDEEARQIALGFLEHPEVWYYHRMNLQALFASKFPNDPESLKIVEVALTEIDGPNPGLFAHSFQSHGTIAPRLMAAAVAAHLDVRTAVADTLRDRAVDYGTVAALSPLPFAEESSAVRASCLIARAKAARSVSTTTAEFPDKLMEELTALGSEMDKRRRSALAALLELGMQERIAQAYSRKESPLWHHALMARLETDAVSIGTVVQYWDALQPALRKFSVNDELPIAEIVYEGYGALLEQTSWGRQALDRYFEVESRDWVNSAYLETFARRHPGSPALLKRLVQIATHRWSGDAITCTAARLLAKHFAGIPDIWEKMGPDLGGSLEQRVTAFGMGVLGHLVLGWSRGAIASWVHSVPASRRTRWSPRDRLLVAISERESDASEAAAAEVVQEPVAPWWYRHPGEGGHALRIWVESGLAKEALSRWINSGNPSRVATAASLVAHSHAATGVEIDKLRTLLANELSILERPPLDGLDAAIGRHTSLAVSLYSAMRRITGTSDTGLLAVGG